MGVLLSTKELQNENQPDERGLGRIEADEGHGR